MASLTKRLLDKLLPQRISWHPRKAPGVSQLTNPRYDDKLAMFTNTNERLYQLYRTLRSSFPFLNRAIILYTRLVGYPKFVSDSEQLNEQIAEFDDNLKVNDLQKGTVILLKLMIDSYLETGESIIEVVPDLFMREVARLNLADTSSMKIVKDEGVLKFAQAELIGYRILPNQEFLTYAAHDLRGNDPVGRSIYDALPIVSQIYYRFLKAIESQAERIQNISFNAAMKVDKDTPVNADSIQAFTNNLSADLETWQKMKSLGQIADIVTPPPPGVDYRLDVIGGNVNIMSMDISLKTIMTQFESATQIPGFLLGNYTGGSQAFRLTQHQADIIAQDVWSMRYDMETLLRFLHGWQIAFAGGKGKFIEYEWEGVSLLDMVETARAQLLNEQARKVTVEYYLLLFDRGLIPDEVFLQGMIQAGIIDEMSVKSYGRERFLALVKNNHDANKILDLIIKNSLGTL